MYPLKRIGRLTARDASYFDSSRLGIGFEKLDRAVFDPERAYDKLGKLGIKWVRLQSGWARTEKTPGTYDFAWLDSIVDNLIARKMTPWLCLCYGNPLYDDFAKTIFGAVGCPPIYTDEQKAAWRAYVGATARHFQGRIRHFEVWNEPDGRWCWKKGVSATELGNFVIETSKALREANPDVYVIGGSICMSPVGYLNQAFETGMGSYIDGLTFHEYTYTEQNVSQKVRAIKGLCGLRGISPDIIQGESGAQSKPEGHGALADGAWTERKQAKLLLRHMTADLLSGVLFTSFFTCVDMIEALNGTVGDKASYLDYGYFGVLGADFDENGVATGEYTPKLSYCALQNLASLLGGRLENVELPVMFRRESVARLGGELTAAAHELIWGGFRLDGGSFALAYWRPAELMTSEWEGAATIECAIPGEIRLVDPMDGAVYELPESAIERDAYGASVLRQLPARDYPMFLVFGELPGGFERER